MEFVQADFINAVISKIQEIFAKGFGWWQVIGYLGIAIFGARFIVQWIVSEIKKESVIPISFWYLSIIGSLLSLTYALHISDPVFIMGYVFNCLIYFRNLYFIYSKKKRDEVQV